VSNSLTELTVGTSRIQACSTNRSTEVFDEELKTSILIADDHLLLAEAVGRALSSKPREFRTCIAGTLDETLKELSAAIKFDLVLLDLKMPGMVGLKSVERVIAAAAPVKVVLMSGHADRAFVQSAIAKGARGLIPKTLPLRSLRSAIDLVLSGQIFIPVDGCGELWNSDLRESSGMSDREVNIARMLSDGKSNKEIASEFDETETTVKMNMRSICRKLNARNRAHVVMICKERNLI
jgi:two-component system nitrate/nitrite response regulator NarP